VKRVASVLTLALAVSACATSTYDRAWVGDRIGAVAGHAVRQAPSDGFAPSLPASVADAAHLGEDDAVAIALWNSAQFQADLAALGTTRADLEDAGALPNPTLSFLFPISTRQFELSALYSVSALVQRPWRVAAEKLDVERAARSLVQSGIDFARDVRVAYAELVVAERRKKARERLDDLVQKSAALAAARFGGGDVSALEANIVKGEALASAEQRERSKHEIAASGARLRMLLGLAESPLGANIGVKDDAARTHEPPSLERAEKAALAARPDVRAAEIAIEAAGERLGLERARVVQLMARLDAKPIGTRGGDPVLWIPGATAELPIFSQNDGGRSRATAEIERASWTYLAVRQRVLTDVRVAREELAMALGSLEPWTTKVLPLLQKNVATAIKSYEGGADAYIVVLEATRRLVEAELRALDLELDVRRARAQLDRAIGWRIDAK